MSDNQGTAGTTPQPISQGTSVFDAGGETVGIVKEYNPQGNYLVVQQGWFFDHDVYVPLDAVGDRAVNGIYLRYPKAELQQQNWDSPPTGAGTGSTMTSTGTGGMAAGTGAAGTAPGWTGTGAAGTTGTTGTTSAMGAAPTTFGTGTTDTTTAMSGTGTGAAGPTMSQATGGSSATTMSQQFPEGTPVYDVNGDEIGTVSEHGVQDNALVIHHGLLRDDIYIPLSAIQNSGTDGIYLNITKDQALSQTGATTMQSGMGAATTGTGMATVGTAQERIPVVEEELVAGKRQEEIGRVHLHKEVVEEQQTVNVPLQQERVTVERVPVQGDATTVGATDAFQEKDIDVPVMGEEAIVEKRAREVEEVRLQKEAVTKNEQVSDTVRKERVVVDGADDQGLGTGAQRSTFTDDQVR